MSKSGRNELLPSIKVNRNQKSCCFIACFVPSTWTQAYTHKHKLSSPFHRQPERMNSYSEYSFRVLHWCVICGFVDITQSLSARLNPSISARNQPTVCVCSYYIFVMFYTAMDLKCLPYKMGRRVRLVS